MRRKAFFYRAIVNNSAARIPADHVKVLLRRAHGELGRARGVPASEVNLGFK